MLRRNIVSTQVSTTASSQYLRLTYFTARKTETITQVRTLTGATPATSATLCKIGIFSEDPATGNLTRVAVTADEKANIWLAASTAYTVSLASGFTKTKGTRYAVACLYVGTGNAPTFYGNASIVASEAFVAPRIAAMGPASTDMPTSISNSSLTAQSHQVYTVLLP